MRGRDARRLFLGAALVWVAWCAFGAIVGWLAALPASNGRHGNVHDVGSQAIYGNGTALSPPLWLLAVWTVFVLAATRPGWWGRVGALLTFLAAGFFFSAGQLGELTTSTSPLTGAKWTTVLVLGAIGEAIALTVLLTGLSMVIPRLVERVGGSRLRTD